MTLRQYKVRLALCSAALVSALSMNLGYEDSPKDSFAAYCTQVRSELAKLDKLITARSNGVAASTSHPIQGSSLRYMDLYREWLKCVVGHPNDRP